MLSCLRLRTHKPQLQGPKDHHSRQHSPFQRLMNFNSNLWSNKIEQTRNSDRRQKEDPEVKTWRFSNTEPEIPFLCLGFVEEFYFVLDFA